MGLHILFHQTLSVCALKSIRHRCDVVFTGTGGSSRSSVWTIAKFITHRNYTLPPPMASQPSWAKASSLLRFRDDTQLDTPHSVGLLRTSDRPVAAASAWQTHNTYKRQTPQPPAGFEPAIPVSERPHSHALDRAATGIGGITHTSANFYMKLQCVNNITRIGQKFLYSSVWKQT